MSKHPRMQKYLIRKMQLVSALVGCKEGPMSASPRQFVELATNAQPTLDPFSLYRKFLELLKDSLLDLKAIEGERIAAKIMQYNFAMRSAHSQFMFGA